MLSRANRLQGDKSVARIYRRGQSVRVGPLSLKHAPNQLDRSRLGVVVSKKISKSAPKRNRIRRRIYEHYRRNWDRVVPGQDMLVSVFADTVVDEAAPQLAEQLNELLRRAKLWVDPPAS